MADGIPEHNGNKFHLLPHDIQKRLIHNRYALQMYTDEGNPEEGNAVWVAMDNEIMGDNFKRMWEEKAKIYRDMDPRERVEICRNILHLRNNRDRYIASSRRHYKEGSGRVHPVFGPAPEPSNILRQVNIFDNISEAVLKELDVSRERNALETESLLSLIIILPAWFGAVAMCYTCSVVIYVFVGIVGLFGVQVKYNLLELSKTIGICCFTVTISILIVSYDATFVWVWVIVSNYVLAKAFFNYSLLWNLDKLIRNDKYSLKSNTDYRTMFIKCKKELKKCKNEVKKYQKELWDSFGEHSDLLNTREVLEKNLIECRKELKTCKKYSLKSNTDYRTMFIGCKKELGKCKNEVKKWKKELWDSFGEHSDLLRDVLEKNRILKVFQPKN